MFILLYNIKTFCHFHHINIEYQHLNIGMLNAYNNYAINLKTVMESANWGAYHPLMCWIHVLDNRALLAFMSIIVQRSTFAWQHLGISTPCALLHTCDVQAWEHSKLAVEKHIDCLALSSVFWENILRQAVSRLGWNLGHTNKDKM